MILRNAIIASSSATFGQTANSLPTACGAEGVICTRRAREREYIIHPNMLNCRLAEGEKSHLANYRGCRHAKEKMQKKKSQRTPKNTTGRSIPSKLTTPGVSFAAALRGKTEEQQQPQTHQVADPATMEPRVPVALPQQQQQKAGQSVRAPNVNNLSLDKMLKLVTVVQQIKTESNGAVLKVKIKFTPLQALEALRVVRG
jgi:hypothetical protein